ncbi:MAG: hypothetical protein Q8T09_22450 [Candidatus Melainabacteria bacterium]|nr:hypothetical protein [Candidatus Melainabacteria bacterium]
MATEQTTVNRRAASAKAVCACQQASKLLPSYCLSFGFGPFCLVSASLLSTFCLAISLPPVKATPNGKPLVSTSSKQKPESFYVLHFPAKGKIGRVGEAEIGADYSDKHTPTKKFAEANGAVRLTKGTGICFIATDFMGLEKPVDIICTLPAEAVTSISLSNNIFEENEVVKLLRFTNLKRLELTGTEVTDETMAKLAPLQQLVTLVVDRTRVKGQFLASLSGKKNIRNLHLGHNELNKKILDDLKKFPNLERLSLPSAHLRDTDMAAIAACPKLKYIDISDNNDLTNTGIAQLKTLKNLEQIKMPFTAANAKGLLALKGIALVRVRMEPKQATGKDVISLKKTFPKLEIDFENMKKELFNDYQEAFE